MKIKSFYGETMDMAFQLAAKEYGDEALILNSRTTPPEFRHFGAYELVCAVGEDVVIEPKVKPVKAAIENPLAAKREEIAVPVATPEATEEKPKSESWIRPWNPPVLKDANEPSNAAMTQAQGTPISQEMPEPSRPVQTQSDAPIRTKSSLSTEWIALVGLHGSGKTTACLKIAIQEGIRSRRKTCIVSSNGHRVGGDAVLTQYASLAGIPVIPLDEEKEQSILEGLAGQYDLVLLDTPPSAGSDLAFARTRQLLSQREGRTWQIHLTLPITLDSSLLNQTCERFASMKPAYLLPTFVDLAVRGHVPELGAVSNPLKTRWCSAGPDVLTQLVASNIVIEESSRQGAKQEADPELKPENRNESHPGSIPASPAPNWSSLLNRYRNSSSPAKGRENGNQFAA